MLAVGSPLGLEQTVTVGIVSGKGAVGRNMQMSGDRVREYIQTDAKINPGNSGGPLVNLDGEVVGINTLIRVGAGGAYGFAVPINEARRVAQVLIKEGRMQYPYLGVRLGDMSRASTRTCGPKLGSGAPDKGALVGEVTPGGPAAKVGIKPGDVITRVDDRQVQAGSDVVDHVSTRGHRRRRDRPGLAGRGQPHARRATLAEAPSGDAAEPADAGPDRHGAADADARRWPSRWGCLRRPAGAVDQRRPPAAAPPSRRACSPATSSSRSTGSRWPAPSEAVAALQGAAPRRPPAARARAPRLPVRHAGPLTGWWVPRRAG